MKYTVGIHLIDNYKDLGLWIKTDKTYDNYDDAAEECEELERQDIVDFACPVEIEDDGTAKL